MKITVKQGQQVHALGTTYTGGEVVDLPAAEARAWIEMGRADEVEADKPKDTKSKK